VFDGFFEYILILIPIAVFIFRIVNNFRKPEKPVVRSGGEGFSEDDEDDETPPPRPVVEKVPPPAVLKPGPLVPEPKKAGGHTAAAVPAAAAKAPKEAGAFPGNLESLPPLKRAVVLSEILGPPKGL
jgi:hypothetical protein